MSSQTLKLVLCWHMHQPQYRNATDDRYTRPWTWLHAIKDYTDMAAHLESVPGARAVVNFSSILLTQIADYARRVERWRIDGLPVGDPLLDALGGRGVPSRAEKLALTAACLKANPVHMIAAFPAYAGLCDRARAAVAAGEPLDDASFRDLLVWYHLVWSGESLRREQPLLRELQQRARGFGADDARRLLELIGNALRDLVPRYRRLAEQQVVELSVTPHAHPILPLLIDTAVAREAMPDVALPDPGYPGGTERCRWHIERALAVFEGCFGARPDGCWPSEGGVSRALLALLGEYGFAWSATGTRVLSNSIGSPRTEAHFGPWRLGGERRGTVCFFRDDALSDRIGFEYSSWAADDAADDFIAHLEAIRESWSGRESPIVSVIMDGENAWEHYPYNGWYFLRYLYSKLARHAHIELTTFGELLTNHAVSEPLPRLVAGSWVYGDFSVWIGDGQKNRAWERLAAAKSAVDRKLADPALHAAEREAILEQLGVCEGSDWFWWLGGGNRPQDSAEFDGLFRMHLASLYELLGEPLPEDPDTAAEIADETKAAADGGAMRRAGP